MRRASIFAASGERGVASISSPQLSEPVLRGGLAFALITFWVHRYTTFAFGWWRHLEVGAMDALMLGGGSLLLLAGSLVPVQQDKGWGVMGVAGLLGFGGFAAAGVDDGWGAAGGVGQLGALIIAVLWAGTLGCVMAGAVLILKRLQERVRQAVSFDASSIYGMAVALCAMASTWFIPLDRLISPRSVLDREGSEIFQLALWGSLVLAYAVLALSVWSQVRRVRWLQRIKLGLEPHLRVEAGTVADAALPVVVSSWRRTYPHTLIQDVLGEQTRVARLR